VNPVAVGPDTVVSLKIEMYDAQGALLQAGSEHANLLRVEPAARYGAGLRIGVEVEDTFEGGAPRRYTITDLASDKVVLDANHPLAGMALRFFCTITAVREATKEELNRREAFHRRDP
jgi:FKBP-type peptidyl-prolyl cis-trans isomerase SlyD